MGNHPSHPKEHDVGRHEEIGHEDSYVPQRSRFLNGPERHFMHVEIRGDRGVGKTSLSNRLQGEEIPVDDVRSLETESSTVIWSNLEDPLDVLEVTIIDVEETVSSSPLGSAEERGSTPQDTLSNSTSQGWNRTRTSMGSELKEAMPSIAHATLLLVDPRRRSTLEVAMGILQSIDKDTDVLVLVNFDDVKVSERELSREHVDDRVSEYLAQEVEERTGLIRVASCSCLDCYGLEAICIFLRVPFLRLKRKMHIWMASHLMEEIEEASEICFDATLTSHNEYLQHYKDANDWKVSPTRSLRETQRSNSWTRAVQQQLKKLSMSSELAADSCPGSDNGIQERKEGKILAT